MLSRGVDPDSIAATDLLDLTWWAIVDGFPLAGRDRIIDALEEAFDEPVVHTEDTWGQSESDRARSRAMFALAGGPAPPRQPDAGPGGATPVAGSEPG